MSPYCNRLLQQKCKYLYIIIYYIIIYYLCSLNEHSRVCFSAIAYCNRISTIDLLESVDSTNFKEKTEMLGVGPVM
jgi:hypothetical protein